LLHGTETGKHEKIGGNPNLIAVNFTVITKKAGNIPAFFHFYRRVFDSAIFLFLFQKQGRSLLFSFCRRVFDSSEIRSGSGAQLEAFQPLKGVLHADVS